MKKIEHITITTGASRMSPRSEVDTIVVDRIRGALAGSGGELWDTGWSVKLLPTPEGGHVFDLSLKRVTVARCWLCADRSVSDELWEAAKSAVIDKSVKLTAPCRIPWLAAALLPQALLLAASDPGALMAAGDLERCVAWALLD